MPRNASGVYSLPLAAVVTNTVISSVWANTSFNDFATTFTQSIAYDGTTTPVANLPMGNFRHTGVAIATAQACYGSVTDIQNGTLVTLGTVAGTNAITAVAPFTVAAYAAGQCFRFIAAGTNSGATTINISGLGIKSITKFGTTALNAADIASGGVYEIVYDGTQFQLIGARQGGSVAAVTTNSRSSNTIFAGGDLGSVNIFTGSFTQTFTAAATLGAGWYVDVQSSATGTSIITFDPNGSETILTPSGARTTICMYPGEGYRIYCDGVGFYCVGRSQRVSAYSYTSGGADATVDLEQGFLDTEVGSIDIEITNAVGAGTDAQLRVKKSGSYITGSTYKYRIGNLNSASWTFATSDGAAFAYWCGIANFNFGISARITISKPTFVSNSQAIRFVASQTQATDGILSEGGIYESTSAAIQGIRIYPNSGNITAGTFVIWINRA